MNKLKIATVAIILLLGLFLRLHNYELYPQRGASSDEYTYSFLGISLITKHFPESWSNLNAYPNTYDLTIRNLYFPMVHPYFDHPPLNGLLVGGWSIINNQSSYKSVDLKTIRLVPIFLSPLSSILLFLIGRKLFGYRVAVWSLLIYSCATIFVMNQRVVFAENLLTPILLGSIYLYIQNKTINLSKVVLLATLSGLAFWTKELGIVVFISVLYLFFEDKRKLKYILIFCGLFFVFLIGYIAYGYVYDGDLFWKIVSIQSARRLGPETVLLLTSHPVIVNKAYLDGWYLLGFVSFFFALFDFKKYKILIIPSLTYFMLMIFSLAKDGEMGWYVIPMFPFMSLFTAKFLADSLEKGGWFIFLLLILVGLFQIKYLYEFNFGLTPTQFRVLILIMFGPFIALRIFHKESAFKLLGNIWFYLLIFGSILLTYNYTHPV